VSITYKEGVSGHHFRSARAPRAVVLCESPRKAALCLSSKGSCCVVAVVAVAPAWRMPEGDGKLSLLPSLFWVRCLEWVCCVCLSCGCMGGCFAWPCAGHVCVLMHNKHPVSPHTTSTLYVVCRRCHQTTHVYLSHTSVCHRSCPQLELQRCGHILLGVQSLSQELYKETGPYD
jgi:hypothetical protein